MRPGSSAAAHSVIRRATSCSPNPAAASTSARLPCSRNSCGIARSRTGTSHSAGAQGVGQRRAEAAVPAAVGEGDDQPVLPRHRDDGGGHRQHPARVDDRDRHALARQPGRRGHAELPERPGADEQHLAAAGPPSCRTSTPSTRRTAGTDSITAPLGNRIAVGPSSTATASASSSRNVAASRGAATRMPGTMPSSDRSHMPLCDGPSLPVTPALSSTSVTACRCSATSSSSWSKARLRNVEYTATTGCRPA